MVSILEKTKLEKGTVYKPSRTGSAKILKNIRISAPEAQMMYRFIFGMSATGNPLKANNPLSNLHFFQYTEQIL